MSIEPNISCDFNFVSKYVDVDGSKLHYIDVGEGEPIVFVHGVPTSCYLWRNIIPTLQSSARCIALDLIGFGKSAKPHIDYTIKDHIYYFEKFIKALNLKNIVLVLHGWGSVIGFSYFAKLPANVKAIVFYESHLQPETDWKQLSLPMQQLAFLLSKPSRTKKAILVDDYFFKKIFPKTMLHLPDKKIIATYQQPFSLPEYRRPLLQYVYDLPIGNSNVETGNLIANYSKILIQSSIPKLMFYTIPGFITSIETVCWCKRNIGGLEIIDLGEELHFAQESMPTVFAQNLNNWYQEIKTAHC